MDVFTLLQDKVRAAKVSGNLDAPEGGFDAIMQAVACEVWIQSSWAIVCLTIQSESFGVDEMGFPPI